MHNQYSHMRLYYIFSIHARYCTTLSVLTQDTASYLQYSSFKILHYIFSIYTTYCITYSVLTQDTVLHIQHSHKILHNILSTCARYYITGLTLQLLAVISGTAHTLRLCAPTDHCAPSDVQPSWNRPHNLSEYRPHDPELYNPG